MGVIASKFITLGRETAGKIHDSGEKTVIFFIYAKRLDGIVLYVRASNINI